MQRPSKLSLVFFITGLILMFSALISRNVNFNKTLISENIPYTSYQIEVESTKFPYGVQINIVSDSSSEELMKYPIHQDLAGIVKENIDFKWEDDVAIISVKGETKIAEFKVKLNRDTSSFDYGVNTYINNNPNYYSW